MSGDDLTGWDLNGQNLTNAQLNNSTLTQANLSGANLTNAYLGESTLTQANLVGANLTSAQLYFATLNGANLASANLTDAYLGSSALTEANLSGANLSRANLSEADLSEANLEQAVMGSTLVADVDLSAAKGLESVRHFVASTIGVDTLFRSQGRIPPAFLRGCGVPDVLIEHLSGLIGAMQPIQFYSCFISYSSLDDAFAGRLHGRLEQEKLRVWFAPEDMRGGRKSGAQIDEAIRLYDRLLLVLSPHSIGSEWVRREIKRARQKERQSKKEVLFPIRLMPFAKLREWECLDADTGEDLAEKVREYHIPDLSEWKDHDAFERGFADLMRDLRRDA